METQTNQYQITRGKTLITIPHLDSNLTFVYEMHGPDNYPNVGNSIEQAGLLRPTMAETASLVHQAFKADEPEFNEIKRLIKNNWLWAFTGSLYIPNKGAYIQDDPEIRNGMPFMEESDLVKRLKANDPKVRFVPFGFQVDEMNSRELEKNRYVIGLAGEEGASKLAKVAGKHRNKKPYLWSFESVSEPLIRVAALGSGFGFVLGSRLGIDGYYHGDGRDGCSFGVSETGEASRSQKNKNY